MQLLRIVCISFLFFTLQLSAEDLEFWRVYQAGIRLEKEGRWEEAIERFQQAADLQPEPIHQRDRVYDPYIHLAFCEIKTGQLATAREHLIRSHSAGVTPILFRAKVKRELEKAMKMHQSHPPQEFRPPMDHPVGQPPKPITQLRVESTPSGVRIKIDDREVGLTPLEVPVDPGKHSIYYSLKGYESGKETVDVKEGSQTTTLLVLTRKEEPPISEEATKSVPATKRKKNQEPSASLHPHSSGPARPRITIPQLIPPLIALAVLTGALFLLYKTRKTAASDPDTTPTLSIPADTVVEAGNATRWEPRTPITPTAPKLEEILAVARPLTENTQKEFGAYRLVGVLGRGGMGTTYVAVRRRDDFPVALKVPHEHLMDQNEFIQRFLREGALGATLHHPNIIRIFEAGRFGEKPFIAMELLKGQTLNAKLRDGRNLPLRDSLEIARDIALALDYAGLKGIVHRDLKPENIMLLDRGGLKVMDFGIAKIMNQPGLTATNYYLGTPSYSAPEAADGKATHQSDLYSLGVILYHTLTGQLPFAGSTPFEIFEKHRNAPIPPFPSNLEIPETVFRVIEKLLAKNPADRYPRAETFLVELNQLLQPI